ncbi:NAD(P)-dependent oxidoreductase [Granulosicoccus antarcticus]|uniref:2-(Hydroxymethyl)glutarate dehydrogenase n=1 Tax=Granulosicoccus antarcticus IMCC3135 TaxID=1192854 RepID=A0A2Z2NY60_9GAMM|nr:NAD(P)-dependent oxidoreductase [Granulosicoccus antarcticus]ASJ76223.1 2-(hydroxymethyl)glutarate dehydrogenase [Granulosicoccus antarcticus IMCC3135]
MIGIVGCGAMGGAMVQRLLEQGQSLVCHDATPEARRHMAATGAEVVDDLAAVASRCKTIILSLPKADIVRAVMSDLGPLLQAGTVILDTSTSEPDTTRELAAQAEKAGYVFIDGPVSGGPNGARNGTMTMVLGGAAESIESLRPLLAQLTAKTVHIGASGSGHATKIANNLLCAANLALMGEMARLAETQGVSLERLLEGVNAGSGRSGVSEVNFPLWILNEQYNSGFTMGLMRKDVGLAVSLAERTELDLPATRAIAAIWEASRDGLPDSADFNEIYKLGNTPDV